MDIAHTTAAERIARVIAGHRLSANADGADSSAGTAVDRVWREHLGEAVAILHTLREPDAAMAEVGDAAVWERMVRVAIERAEKA
ncbi:hypothetical protein [Sphingomonas sp.]|jgi:hypothetical protein|uniref:hypothetical protein n=1 Tax=Sphingomonas sp. TaxID=28214 RepID=UPI002EDB9AD6